MPDINTETRQNSLFNVDITWFETKNNEKKKYIKTIVQIAKNRERAEEIAKMLIPWSIKEKPEVLSNLSIKTQQFKSSSNIIEKILYKSPVIECKTTDLEDGSITPEGETLIRIAYNYSSVLNKISNLEIRNKLKTKIESDLVNIVDKTNKRYNNGAVMPADKLIETMLKSLAASFGYEEIILSELSDSEKITELEYKIKEYEENLSNKDNKIEECNVIIDEKTEKILNLEKELKHCREILKIKEEQLSNKNEIVFDNKLLDEYMEKHSDVIKNYIENNIKIIDKSNFEDVIDKIDNMENKAITTEDNISNMNDEIAVVLKKIPKILDDATKNMEKILTDSINEKIQKLNESMKVIEDSSKKGESVVLAKSANIKEELENINAAVFTTAKECEESINTIIKANKDIVEYENIIPRATFVENNIYNEESSRIIKDQALENIMEKARAIDGTSSIINNDSDLYENTYETTLNEENIEKTMEDNLEKEIKRINNIDDTPISDVEIDINDEKSTENITNAIENDLDNDEPMDVEYTECENEETDNNTIKEKEVYYISDINPGLIYDYLTDSSNPLYMKLGNNKALIKDFIETKNITIEQPNVLFNMLKSVVNENNENVLNDFLENKAHIPVEKFTEIDKSKSIGK